MMRWLRELRERRDEKAWRQCYVWFEHADESPEYDELTTCSGWVVGIRQVARTGIKAYVRWNATKRRTGVWIKGCRFLPRGPIVVSGVLGYGPHHDEPVVYVNQYMTFSKHTWRRAKRYARTQQERYRRDDFLIR